MWECPDIEISLISRSKPSVLCMVCTDWNPKPGHLSTCCCLRRLEDVPRDLTYRSSKVTYLPEATEGARRKFPGCQRCPAHGVLAQGLTGGWDCYISHTHALFPTVCSDGSCGCYPFPLYFERLPNFPILFLERHDAEIEGAPRFPDKGVRYKTIAACGSPYRRVVGLPDDQHIQRRSCRA